MAMRVPKIEDAPHPAGSLDAPVATVPMLVRDVCVGAITIVSVFPQKERWAGVDREFLALLGSHGGTALMAASLQADRSADLHGPGKSNTYDPLDALRNIHEHLARFRDRGGSLTRAAFLSARNDVFANFAIIGAGFATVGTASAWPDLAVGLAIFWMNLGAAREVYAAARHERDEVSAPPGRQPDDDEGFLHHLPRG